MPPSTRKFSGRIISIVRAALAASLAVLGALQSGPPLAAHVAAAGPAKPAGAYSLYLPLTVRTQPPTSDELINAAEAAGQISSEQALIYKVFAAFDDPRLPAQYHGDDSQVTTSSIMVEVMQQWPGLSSGAQAILTPFRIPPIYTNSWLQQRQTATSPAAPGVDTLASGAGPTSPFPLNCGDIAANMSAVDTLNGKVRVWYFTALPADALGANSLAAELDAYLWDKLVNFMGRAPRSDAGVDVCDPPDGRLDIYWGMASRSITEPYNSPCGSAVYMLLSGSSKIGTWAHELFHAIQFAFDFHGDCQDYGWLMEATAQWVIDYAYDGQTEEEQRAAPAFLNFPLLPLDTYNDSHEYGSYLFIMYLRQTYGADVVRSIWAASEKPENTDTFKTLDNVLSALGDGLTADWTVFSLDAWNRDSVERFYEWDQIQPGAKPELDAVVSLNSVLDAEYAIPAKLPHMTARYVGFTFTGANVRSIAFENHFTSDSAAHVQALFKFAGQSAWHWELWDDKPGKVFCRDFAAERLEELVLVFSNGQWQDRQAEHIGSDSFLRATNIGCARWAGSATAHVVYNDGSGDQIEDTTSNFTMVRWRPPNQPDGNLYSEYFLIVDGGASWTHTGTFAPPNVHCTGSGSGNYSLAAQPGEGSGSLGVLTYVTSGPSRRVYSGNAVVPADADYTITYTCDDNIPAPSFERPGITSAYWNASPLGTTLRVNPDGVSIDGTHSTTSPDGTRTETWTWHLLAQPGP